MTTWHVDTDHPLICPVVCNDGGRSRQDSDESTKTMCRCEGSVEVHDMGQIQWCGTGAKVQMCCGHKRCGAGARGPGCTRIELVNVEKSYGRLVKGLLAISSARFILFKLFVASRRPLLASFPVRRKPSLAAFQSSPSKSGSTSEVGSRGVMPVRVAPRDQNERRFQQEIKGMV